MDTRRIGQLAVSIVGLGCNNLGRRIDAERTQAVVDAAIEAGVTLFDTADAYGGGASEELLGRALGSRRDQVVIATKFGSAMPGGEGASPAWVRQAAEDSLRRLGTDHIDLYQLHNPDHDTPIAETLGALDELVHEGKVLEIGHSNLDGPQIDSAEKVALDAGGTRFVCAQNRWSVITRDVEVDVIPAVERNGLTVLPYFPLESGLLTGKYLGEESDPSWRLNTVPEDRRDRFMSDRHLTVARELQAFAQDRGHSLLELAVSWLLDQDTVASVIAGATRPEQVRGNVAAAGWRMSADEQAEIDRITGAS